MQILLTNEIILCLKERYLLHEPKFTPLGKERYQHVYKVEDSGKTYILRLYNESTNIEKPKKDITVLQFLANHQFLAPQIIETVTKETVFHIENIAGYLATYIDGKMPQLTEEPTHAIGKQLAGLHILDITNASLPLSSWNISEMHRHLQEQTQKFKGRKLENDEVVSDLLKAFSELPDLTDMPKVLIHTDIGPHNTIQTPSDEMVFIDWDDAGIGTAIIDVAFMLAQVCINVENDPNKVFFDTNIARAYLDGYTSIRPFNQMEKNNMLTAMKFCTLSYVFQEWGPLIDMLNWKRYQFECNNTELINKLLK